MTTDQPRSRRSLLAAGIGGAIGALGAALGRPLPAEATVKTMSTGTDNAADAETRLYRTNDGVVFSAFSPTMPAFDVSGAVVTVGTNQALGIGVFAEAIAANGYGLYGASTASDGIGVKGRGGFYGVVAEGQGVAVEATGEAAGSIAVHATAPYANSTAVSATCLTADSLALDVAGRARFNRAGRVNVAANASSVDVTVTGGLAAGSFIVATIQANRTGVYVRGVRLNYPSTGKARIYLNKVASTTATTPVGWIAFG